MKYNRLHFIYYAAHFIFRLQVMNIRLPLKTVVFLPSQPRKDDKTSYCSIKFYRILSLAMTKYSTDHYSII